MNEKLNYANWIPRKLLIGSGLAGIISVVLFCFSFLMHGGAAALLAHVIAASLAILCLSFFGYMSVAYRALSYEVGGVQGQVLDHLLAHLDWDGKGNLLDIGCGSGAMAIKAAKKYPDAWITGIDYWGVTWDYAQSQCEKNAALENVDGRVHFQKGDAAKLDFADASFDAVVSNFVFHEVKSQPDKLALIREALRVVKPGGVFSFGDVFFSKKHYGSPDKLIAALSKTVFEIHLADTRRSDLAPRFLHTPLVLGETALIYGRK
jgi:ubiquinone/menaquinone biosynthesis C-methylase UbiE